MEPVSEKDLPSALLTYRISTNPGPLQASTPQSPLRSRINITISQGDHTVYCNQLKVSIPLGPGGDCFSNEAPDVSVSTSKWTMESSTILPGAAGHPRYAVFQFSARDESDYKISYDLQISINGIANVTAGPFEIQLREHSGIAAGASKFEWKQMKLGMGKSTPEFYLKNFVATTPAAYSVPCTEFKSGADVRLAWESNGTWFQVFRRSDAKPVWSGRETQCVLKGEATSDATFILSACVIGTPGGDTSGAFQPIYLYDSLGITVSGADLSPKNINAAGNLAVNGSTTVKALTVGAALNAEGTLNVKQKTTLAETAISGTFTAASTSKLKATTIEGTLSVNQLADLYAVQIKNELTAPTAKITTANITTLNVADKSNLKNAEAASLKVSGNFLQQGPAQLFSKPEVIRPGKYVAECDLLITAAVSAWDNKSREEPCMGMVAISTSECDVQANGGNLSGPPGWTGYNIHGTCTAIVRKGKTYTLSVTNMKGNVAYAFYQWKLGYANT